MKDVSILKENGIDVDSSVELLGDIDMYNSLLSDFYDSYQDRMAKIELYKNNNDMANYAIEVHSLKSDSKYLGFTTLANYAYEHEMASKASDINSVDMNYNILKTEAQRIFEIIKQYLNNTDDGVSEVPPQVSLISNEEVLLSTKAILVADDSSIVRNFIKDIFNNDYDILLANNGNQVISMIEANPNSIAALLLDLNMPEMDGFQVLDYFKEKNLFSKIPVSIISGSQDKASIDRAFEYPIVDMLNKPFTKENVKLVVEKTLFFNNAKE